MSIDTEQLKNNEFERDVKKLITDVNLTYSTVDKKYMTDASVNYSIYTHAELCEELNISNVTQRSKLKTLIMKYGTVIDARLPSLGIEGDIK